MWPPLSHTSSEAGALPLEVQIENGSDRKFSKSKFVHSFLETTFLHVSCYPVIVSRKYIYGFPKSAPTSRYTILDSRLPPCNAILEGRPHLSNTISEAGALPLELYTRYPIVARRAWPTGEQRYLVYNPKRYVSKMTRTEYFF